jgi:HlyD family secretion protein
LIHAPFDGRVLKIHAWPGEEVGRDGIMELGRTKRMYVIAEVVETDVPRLRPGQRATITSEVFPGTIHGTVEQVALNVARSQVLNIDPAAYSDSRVVEAKIRLDDVRRVEGLIHAQVKVSISTQNGERR